MRESKVKANESITSASSKDFWLYPAHRVTRRVYEEWHEDRKLQRAFTPTPLQHEDACYVAFAKHPFGEGAERFAHRFFEIGSDMKTIVGPPMVAKESRLVLAEDGFADEEARWKFVKTFCSTQQLARRLASEFNEKMEGLFRVDNATPRISILDCSIYQLQE